MASKSGTFAANTIRLYLHALAYNLANFMRTLALSLSGATFPWGPRSI